MKELQELLLKHVFERLDNEFHICSENRYKDSSKKSFYSPYIIGFMGILLNKIKHLDTTELQDRILNKLINTDNIKGIYNFYGNSNYYYDIDTTVVVNTFIYLKSGDLKYQSDLLQTINRKQNRAEGSVLTWINRDRNNVDWFVNFNTNMFLNIINQHDNTISSYLDTHLIEFLDNGSQYYDNTDWPLFVLLFYKYLCLLPNEELPINFLQIKQLSKFNLLYLGMLIFQDIKPKSKEELVTMIDEMWMKDIQYFNSSKACYTSTALNAVVALIILDIIQERYHE